LCIENAIRLVGVGLVVGVRVGTGVCGFFSIGSVGVGVSVCVGIGLVVGVRVGTRVSRFFSIGSVGVSGSVCVGIGLVVGVRVGTGVCGFLNNGNVGVSVRVASGVRIAGGGLKGLKQELLPPNVLLLQGDDPFTSRESVPSRLNPTQPHNTLIIILNHYHHILVTMTPIPFGGCLVVVLSVGICAVVDFPTRVPVGISRVVVMAVVMVVGVITVIYAVDFLTRVPVGVSIVVVVAVVIVVGVITVVI